MKIIYYKKILMIIILFLPMLSFSENKQEAIKYFQKAVGVDKWDLQTIIVKEQLYKKAIEIYPEFAEAHNNLGDIYERQQRYQEAIKEYKKAIEINPNLSISYLSLGDVYYTIGNCEEAVKWYEKGLKYNPDDGIANERIKRIKGLKKGEVINAETIRQLLTPKRGRSQVISISFGEGLIPFDFDKYEIREDAKIQLNEIGKALNDMIKKRDIIIEGISITNYEIAGHTDERGSDEYNLKLSQKRANSVVDYLVKNFNIPKERLIPKGYGERIPIFPNAQTEAQHALNRRVEIIVKYDEGTKDEEKRTRKITQQEYTGKKLILEDAFFYKRGNKNKISLIEDEKTILYSNSDCYFLFFRPKQDCYVYIIQIDSSGKIDLIFPEEGENGFVKGNKDYWIPCFGKGFTLDNIKGKETIYILVTSWDLTPEIQGISLKQQVMDAVEGFKTRKIGVIKPSQVNISINNNQELQNPNKLNSLLEKIEGEGAFVKIVSFLHE